MNGVNIRAGIYTHAAQYRPVGDASTHVTTAVAAIPSPASCVSFLGATVQQREGGGVVRI